MATSSTDTGVHTAAVGKRPLVTTSPVDPPAGCITRHVGPRSARMAVAEERLRFSRDVHDILGRRLSTIAVLSELAATLAGHNDDRAAALMQQVRGLAHEALAEARELARGYQPTDLGRELDGARSLLQSAGIHVELHVEVVPTAWQEAAGWVVRESVTNLLRHSAARGVRISFLGDELRVGNDGVPGARTAAPVDGSGLRLLRERLAPLGATLVVEGSDDHWSVLSRLPGPGPADRPSHTAA